jgi:hypothetical protein
VSIDFAEGTVTASRALHNFVGEKDGYNSDRTLYAEGLVVGTPNSLPQQAGRSANYVRDHFANYFVSSEGEVHANMIKCRGTGVDNARLGFLQRVFLLTNLVM